MPTNILRRAGAAAPTRARAPEPAERIVRIRVAGVAIRIRLHATATADLIWRQLPIHSTAETWGRCIHFETPVETGRDRTARLNARAGDICYWTEDDRVLIAFGPTPISRPDEMRLMSPCNVWAEALDDVRQLASVTPGEKVVMERGA